MLIQSWSLPAGVLIEGDGRCWWRCVRVARGDPLHIPAARAQPDPQRQPEQLRLPPLDLVCMNPPFTRTCGDNLLFGSLPKPERTRMQKAFQEWCKRNGVEASITAGLGAPFLAAADRCLKPDGRLAFVLPKTLLSEPAWQKSRELLRRNYTLE
jgi:hypothetical protein